KEPPQKARARGPQAVFERSDFDEVLEEVAAAPVPAAEFPAVPAPAHAPVGIDVERVDAAALPDEGFFLSRLALAMVWVGVVVGLMLAFAAGIVVGRLWR